MYHVTDYITKQSSSLYLGLDAVAAALKAKQLNASGCGADHHIEYDRSLMTKIANGFLGRQEVSHQHVMSFLVGGGDKYCSHTFKTLRWGKVHEYISSTGH